jgi:hypothetical protein
MQIGPKQSLKNLKKRTGQKLDDGREHHAGLPGVTSDAKACDPQGNPHCDTTGHRKNRELAERIGDAMDALKASDEHGSRFVLAWRLYPNKDHPAWQQKDVHFCGCGCGCSAPGKGPGVAKAKAAGRKPKQTHKR